MTAIQIDAGHARVTVESLAGFRSAGGGPADHSWACEDLLDATARALAAAGDRRAAAVADLIEHA